MVVELQVWGHGPAVQCSVRAPQPSRCAGEPLVPTATAAPMEEATVAGPPATVSASPGPEETAARQGPVRRDRFGVGVAPAPISDYPVEQLSIGWYLNWGVRISPALHGGDVRPVPDRYG
jgi:hypothetical protein